MKDGKYEILLNKNNKSEKATLRNRSQANPGGCRTDPVSVEVLRRRQEFPQQGGGDRGQEGGWDDFREKDDMLCIEGLHMCAIYKRYHSKVSPFLMQYFGW